MADPIIIGGVVIVAGALAYIFWPGTASAADKAAADKKILDAACAAGTADGTGHGAADKGLAHNPRPLLNYSDSKPVQQQYENCYNDGYEKFWVAPTPVVIKDSTPSTGGAGSMSAGAYGCSRGTSSGRAAYENGEDGNSWAAKLETDGSKKRQAESGDAATYRQRYKECFISAFTQAATEAAIKGTFSGSGKRRAGVGVSGAVSWREPYRPAFVKAA